MKCTAAIQDNMMSPHWRGVKCFLPSGHTGNHITFPVYEDYEGWHISYLFKDSGFVEGRIIDKKIYVWNDGWKLAEREM